MQTTFAAFPQVYTAPDCQAICVSRDDCLNFVFDESIFLCYIKGSVLNTGYNTRYTGGPKTCTEGNVYFAVIFGNQVILKNCLEEVFLIHQRSPCQTYRFHNSRIRNYPPLSISSGVLPNLKSAIYDTLVCRQIIFDAKCATN
jgi:hypothetical protein